MKSDFKMCKTITIDNYYIYILFINYNVMCVWVMNVDVSRQIFYVCIFITFKKMHNVCSAPVYRITF